MTLAEYGTISIEETIDWEDLSPECELMNCTRPGTVPTRLRHLHGGCVNEGAIEIICAPCWEQDRKLVHICITCRDSIICELA